MASSSQSHASRSLRRIEQNMARKKSATARRREGMADNTPTRALVLPLALSPDQHAMYSRLADLYNRVWGSAVSWCDANHSVDAVAAQKALYYSLRARFPQLPAQFVCNALRDATGAVRSWNSSHPKRRWSLRASRRKPTVRFDLRTMGLRGNLLTLSSMHGQRRQRFLLPPIPAWFDERYPERRLQAAALVPAAYTSQTCHQCGHVAKGNRDGQAVFKCVECGYRANADVNAAMNILSRALIQTGGGTASDVEDPQERSREASTPSTQAGSSFGVRSAKGIPRL